jgi:hypothetical protein
MRYFEIPVEGELWKLNYVCNETVKVRLVERGTEDDECFVFARYIRGDRRNCNVWYLRDFMKKFSKVK